MPSPRKSFGQIDPFTWETGLSAHAHRHRTFSCHKKQFGRILSAKSVSKVTKVCLRGQIPIPHLRQAVAHGTCCFQDQYDWGFAQETWWTASTEDAWCESSTSDFFSGFSDIFKFQVFCELYNDVQHCFICVSYLWRTQRWDSIGQVASIAPVPALSEGNRGRPCSDTPWTQWKPRQGHCPTRRTQGAMNWQASGVSGDQNDGNDDLFWWHFRVFSA